MSSTIEMVARPAHKEAATSPDSIQVLKSNPGTSSNEAIASRATGVLVDGDKSDGTRGSSVQAGDQEPEARKLERWNQSGLSVFRYFAVLFSFFVFGMNDACIGPLIPYIEPYYGINHLLASLLFLSPFVGYIIAALMANITHHYAGHRGVALIGPICRLISYIPMALHAPFPLLVVLMLFTGFAGGLQDSAWNAWIGNLQNANELLGFVHGFYGAGAVVSPLVASALTANKGLPWYTYYYIMIGAAALDLVVEATAFWKVTGADYRAAMQAQEAEQKHSPTAKALQSPITWLLSVFLLAYVGIEVSLGGWIVTFMIDVRGAGAFEAGLSATGFWLGLTVGRMTLGFVVARLGEKAAITMCLSMCIALQLVYWLVPNFLTSAIVAGFLGFFLAPMFATAVVVATKLLPTEYHVPAIGFAAAFGGGGAAILPFVVGILAETRGVQSLQYLTLGVFIFIIFIWFCLPGGMKRGGLEKARANNEKVGHHLRQLVRYIQGRSKRSD